MAEFWSENWWWIIMLFLVAMTGGFHFVSGGDDGDSGDGGDGGGD